MKRLLMVMGVVVWLGLATPAQAAIVDWPIIGQVARVGICVLGGTGRLAASAVVHAGAWGAEVLGTVGECIAKIISTPVAITTGLLEGSHE